MKNITLIALLFVVVTFMSCNKVVEDTTKNPFNGGVNDTTILDSINATSIQGLHQNIFAVRCANPACHDGSFEPDFRTIESTYNSLVYQPVIKNDTNYSFTYRVVPYNTDKSWLIERLLTEDPVLGRMPIYSTPLSQPEMDNIKAWINDGAKDITGAVAQFPNKNAEVKYFAGYNFNGVRIDTNRENGWSSPFLISKDSTFIIYAKVDDDSTSSSSLLVNQLKLSTNKDDFSAATTLQATYYTSKLWQVTVPANAFNTGDQVYFRYYVRDPEHIDLTEYPKNTSPYYYKENASFKLQ